MDRPWENGLPKLDEKRAREIYKRIWSGERMQSLADEFGVAKKTIAHIKQGRTWREATADLRAARGVDESAIVPHSVQIKRERQRRKARQAE